MQIPVGFFGLGAVGSAGQIEIDALSFGNDALLPQIGGPSLFFSVDEFALGIPGSPAPPNVTSEGGRFVANREASADIFSRLFLPALPIAPGPVYGNGGIYDGNGAAPFLAPGLSLIEPNAPSAGTLPDMGDNLDALACAPAGSVDVYFSLDAGWLDPLEVAPANSGTAVANGFFAADILQVPYPTGGAPVVWAGFAALGLSAEDDINALMVRDNGNGTFDPSLVPFDWLSGATDMVIFSIRRGSPLVGTPDAFTGSPIEEGDVLTVTGGGGVPGILIPAEALGLRTVRNYGPGPFGYGDDIDALSLPPC